MVLAWWRSVVEKTLASSRRSQRGGSRPRTRRLMLESLEERTLLNAGLPDPTFGAGGLVTTNFSYVGGNNGVAVQADGKIVVAGISPAPTSDFSIARFNPDGTLDTSFGSGGFVTTDF